MVRRALLPAAVCVCIGVTAFGQVADPLERRAHDIAAFFGGAGEQYQDVFSDEFLAQVPPSQLDAIFSDLSTRTGSVTSVAFVSRSSDTTGRFRLHTDKGFAVPVDIVIDGDPPHLIAGLWLSPPIPLAPSFDELVAEFGALHGTVGFVAARLSPAPGVVASLASDTSLALGSGFKLFVLSALHNAIVDGDLGWDTVVRLDPDWKSLPSGLMQDWPDHAPVTIHTLASLMISRSDNTATDALIYLLGRERVEAEVKRIAPQSASRNLPFLTTLEMFQLKSEPGGERARRYLSGDPKQRRQILEEDTLPAPDSLSPFHRPTLIDQIEWFASASEMAALLGDLRSRFDGAHGEPLRSILAINPGLVVDDAEWPYIGFKGGSEPGVLHLSYLLQDASGGWWALIATWNDTEATVDTETLVGLIQRATDLLTESE